MKKAIKYLALALLILPCALLLVACGKVEGNTYTFKSTSSVSWAKEMTDEEKEKAYAATGDDTIKTEEDYFKFVKDAYDSIFKDAKFQFKKDGSVIAGNEDTTTYYYTQDGNNIKSFSTAEKTGEPEFTATTKGSGLEFNISLDENITATLVFKKA